MAVRRKIHLRLCAGAVLLSLPVAATSNAAVSGTPVGAAAATGGSSVPVGPHPFDGRVVTAAGDLSPADTADVALRVRAAGGQRLGSASPTRPTALAALDGVAFEAMDIPRTALVAYQVAATTMAKADPDCSVDWSLLAAIGRVETDHGRHGGAELGLSGVSRPLIRGVALDGKGPVALVRDTDGGRLDDDRRWDRAVGPMQFLPSTWGYSGVDGDGDGVRSPDNVNDAALAAAVYLCAAPGELDRPAGVRAAVHRYNPSKAYVDLVVRIAKGYAEADLTQLSSSGSTLALGAVEIPSSGGPMTGPPPTAPLPGGQGAPSGDRSGDQDRPDPRDERRGKDDDRPGKGQGDDRPGKSGKGTKGGAKVKDPVEALPGIDSEEPLPGFEPKDPRPPKDPEPSKEPKDPKDPAPTPEPKPTDEREPEPVLVELVGTLVLVEADDEAEELADEWWLHDVSVDGDAAEPVLLALGDEEWLAEDAVADLDGSGGEPADNRTELLGLIALGEPVRLQVEEGTEEGAPWTVHAVNEVSVLLTG